MASENRSTATGIGKEVVNLGVLPFTVAAFEVKPVSAIMSGKKEHAHQGLGFLQQTGRTPIEEDATSSQ